MAYKIRQNPSPFFTAGRPNGIRGLVVHHGATTDFDGIGRTFQVAGVSAGYGAGEHGNVDQYVADSNVAYHAGNWNANLLYIGIEHVNSTGAPDWNIAPSTFKTSTELAADLSRRHGWGKLVPFKNVFPHGHFTTTFCPGVLKARLQEYANEVNKLLGAPATQAPRQKRSVQEIATEVMNGKWGNDPQRSHNLRAQGYDPAAIQAAVNARYGIGKPAATKPSAAPLDTVARQVMAGAFGNEPQRSANLRRAGHDPVAVQNRVNQLLGIGTRVPSSGIIAQGQNVQFINPVAYDGTRLGVSGTYQVMEVRGDRAVVGRGGVVTAAVHTTNLRRV